MNKLDTEWFKFYTTHCSFDDIDYLKIDPKTLAREKEKFLKGEIDVPTLSYDIPKEEISHKKASLSSLQETITRSNQPEIIQQAYGRKINEQLLKIELLEKTLTKDDSGFFETSKKLYGIPTKDSVKQAQTLLNKEYADEVSSPEMLGAQEIKKYMDTALEKAEMTKEWRTEITKNKLVVSVSYADKKIFIPENREMTALQTKALSEHEIGIHLTRHFNGLKSNLLLLSSGLDNYLEAEEGLATKAQADIDGKHPSVGGYIAIAHAAEVVADQWSFRGIYDFMCDYRKHMYHLKNEDSIQEQAWTRTIRLFRGTTGQTPGTCFTRDALYFSGYLKIENFLREETKEAQRALKGKYDPTNPEHVALLDYLGL